MKLLPFTASEAFKITGRSLESQRQDRALGLMPKLEGGKARFDVIDLAKILTMQALSREFSVTQRRAAAWANRAALHVAHHALVAQGLVTGKQWVRRP